MGVIAEFRVASPKLALQEALSAVPAMELDLVQQAGTEPDRPYCLAWASGGDFEAFEAAMEADDTVSDVRRYSAVGGRVLYGMQVTAATEVVTYQVWVELGAERLETRWADGCWHTRMRFPERTPLREYRDWCDEVGMDFELVQVYDDEGQAEPATDGLTLDQREAVRLAKELGYYEVPRSATLGDIAAELGVSTQAVSERLRRANATLVERYVE